jgi:hypothetical protein
MKKITNKLATITFMLVLSTFGASMFAFVSAASAPPPFNFDWDAADYPEVPFEIKFHAGTLEPKAGFIFFSNPIIRWGEGTTYRYAVVLGGTQIWDNGDLYTIQAGEVMWFTNDWIRVTAEGEAPPVVTPVTPPVVQTTPANEVTVVIEGVVQNFEVPPQIINGRTMLPLRAICEALGMEVDFNPSTNTAILTLPGSDSIYTHVIGSTQITSNGNGVEQVFSFDVPSITVDGRTLVPVRMIAEVSLRTVIWDGDTRTVNIFTSA